MTAYELGSMDYPEVVFKVSTFAPDATEFKILAFLRVLKRQVLFSNSSCFFLVLKSYLSPSPPTINQSLNLSRNLQRNLLSSGKYYMPSSTSNYNYLSMLLIKK